MHEGRRDTEEYRMSNKECRRMKEEASVFTSHFDIPHSIFDIQWRQRKHIAAQQGKGTPLTPNP